jgi:hypothetical protein
MHDGVEPVDGVSGVFNGTTGSIRVHETISSLDDVSASSLVMFLVVTGVRIVHSVREAVLRGAVLVIHGFDDRSGNWGGIRSEGRRVRGGGSNVRCYGGSGSQIAGSSNSQR